MKKIAILLLCAAALWQCRPQPRTLSGLNPHDFEDVVDGRPTALYTLVNAGGTEVCITNFGGRIVSLMVPDREGRMVDVVLGFDNVRDYETIPSDFGACIGRYANRIDHGRLEIDGQAYQLDTNNFGHTLHGGPTGWQYQVYEAEQPDAQTLRLRISSPDGDNGFPGSVEACCTYKLTDDNVLRMSYEATTTAPTVVNMTNHSYFNLHGGSAPVTDHLLRLESELMTPVDSTFMTTGEICAIALGSPFDFFSAPKAIGQDIDADDEQLRNGRGYDHNWILRPREGVSKAAELYNPENGICLEVYTAEPGIQVYTGNFLDGSAKGKGGQAYGHRFACCLETQKYPDSPNKPEWPSPVLRPGDTYSSVTEFRFSVR